MKREFTATVFIIQDHKVLLVFHRKFQKWMPPGGHLDPNESPTDAAKREAFEETGMHVELIRDESVWYDVDNTRSMERPYRCFVYDIPQFGEDPPHQHMDFVYIGRVIGGSLDANLRESADACWFSLEEVHQIPNDQIFDNTREMIGELLPLAFA